MIVTGYCRNNVIVPTGNLKLPDGTKVSIIIPDGKKKAGTSSGLCGIWKDERPADDIVAELVSARSRGRDVSL